MSIKIDDVKQLLMEGINRDGRSWQNFEKCIIKEENKLREIDDIIEEEIERFGQLNFGASDSTNFGEIDDD